MSLILLSRRGAGSMNDDKNATPLTHILLHDQNTRASGFFTKILDFHVPRLASDVSC